MASILAPEVLRMVERILVVLSASMAIYLGYRLFLVAHVNQDSSGKFRTKVFEFAVSKIGPGFFFAAFGLYVLYASLDHKVETRSRSLDATVEQSSVQRLRKLIEKLPEKADREEAERTLRTIEILRRPSPDPNFGGVV